MLRNEVIQSPLAQASDLTSKGALDNVLSMNCRSVCAINSPVFVLTRQGIAGNNIHAFINKLLAISMTMVHLSKNLLRSLYLISLYIMMDNHTQGEVHD
jgi:hypothetical protein